jgi:diamine N-acetyltransferase
MDLAPFQIRECSSRDAEVITDTIRTAFATVAERMGLTLQNCPSHPAFAEPEDTRRAMGMGIRYFLATSADGCCGCAALDPRDPTNVWLARVSVIPEHRNKGLGQQLVAHVLRIAREMDISSIKIGVIATDSQLVSWYAKQGFVHGEIHSYASLPFQVLIMERQTC